MFTGLIRALGHVHLLSPQQLAIHCPPPLPPFLGQAALGDSIAVDGICLTVEKLLPQGFVATASPETLARTTLAVQASGDRWVNLEPSLRVGDKLGGHFVTGHVDEVAYLHESQATSHAWDLTFQLQSGSTLGRYLVTKGSVAINGVSLTIAHWDADQQQFRVAVIPVTFRETNLQHLKPGSPVNVEADVLGKYVEGLLKSTTNTPPESSLDLNFLQDHGYY